MKEISERETRIWEKQSHDYIIHDCPFICRMCAVPKVVVYRNYKDHYDIYYMYVLYVNECFKIIYT